MPARTHDYYGSHSAVRSRSRARNKKQERARLRNPRANLSIGKLAGARTISRGSSARRRRASPRAPSASVRLPVSLFARDPPLPRPPFQNGERADPRSLSRRRKQPRDGVMKLGARERVRTHGGALRKRHRQFSLYLRRGGAAAAAAQGLAAAAAGFSNSGARRHHRAPGRSWRAPVRCSGCLARKLRRLSRARWLQRPSAGSPAGSSDPALARRRSRSYGINANARTDSARLRATTLPSPRSSKAARRRRPDAAGERERPGGGEKQESGCGTHRWGLPEPR